jgi:hypothetical protein
MVKGKCQELEEVSSGNLIHGLIPLQVLMIVVSHELSDVLFLLSIEVLAPCNPRSDISLFQVILP